MAEMEEILRLTADVGSLKAQTENLQRGQTNIERTALSTKRDLERNLDGKHKENRRSIHDLRDKLDEFFGTVGEQVKALETKVETRMSAIEKRISKIEFKVAVGSALGGLLFAALSEVGKKLIDHFFK